MGDRAVLYACIILHKSRQVLRELGFFQEALIEKWDWKFGPQLELFLGKNWENSFPILSQFFVLLVFIVHLHSTNLKMLGLDKWGQKKVKT